MMYFDRPARHTFIDLSIIAKAPWKYLQAGMGDTIGKFFECHFSARGDKLTHRSALGREISNMCYAPLLEYGVQALKDCKEGKVSLSLEQMNVPLEREYLKDMLLETVTGPDMEHIPYKVSEDMIYEAMEAVERLSIE